MVEYFGEVLIMEDVKGKIHNDFCNLKNNKEEYFEQFYKNNYNFVYRICFSVLKNKDNSEDVTQTVFEKIYKMEPEKLASTYESSWLYTVTKNEAIQYIRKDKPHDSLDENEMPVESGKSEIEELEKDEDYKKIVKKLNKKQEQIVSLKIVSDFTFREIGQMLSMPTATVQWYYYSSIKSLKAAIGSMAMFVVSIVLGVKLYKKVDNTSEQTRKNVDGKDKSIDVEEAASSESKSTGNKNEEFKIPKNIENTEEMTIHKSDTNISADSFNLAPTLCFSVAGICLICSIVFGIVFAKRKKHK